MKKMWWLALAGPLFGGPAVDYRLSFPNAVHHEAEITATFRDVAQPSLEVVMSRSSPGRYALHEFAKNVYQFRASDSSGSALRVMRPNPYGWSIARDHVGQNLAGENLGTVIVHYTLFGDRADGTYDGIDETHAHLNLPATLVWAHGFENAPATLRFEIPPGSGWRIATQLKPEGNDLWSAPDLEGLMDSPVELSAHVVAEWQVENQKFRMAIHQQGSEEIVKLCAKRAQAVVLQAEGVFGSFPKFDNETYTFLMDYLPYAFGDGMEHRNSTSISGPLDLRDSEDEALDTISHEFFHAWNVRRIRPRSLEPFDFERVNMCGELWFAEGFTSYYGPLLMERAGLITLDEFARTLSGFVNRVLNAPGHEMFSVVEMSEQAAFVDAARSIDATNFRNTFISYYTYGAALAFGLDLSIRQRFPGKSLDDWMRVMWRLHPDINEPYTLEDLETALAEATGSKEFAATFFKRHINGREPLDYAQLVTAAGLKLRKAHAGKPWIGAAGVETGVEGVKLADAALRGSPLYAAGLDVGDEITHCDGKVLKKTEDFHACLAKRFPGEQIALEYVSRSGAKKVTVPVLEDPDVEIVTFENVGFEVAESVKFFRREWLGSKAMHGSQDDPVVNW
jgi:predicted metalloprotease with PDZ domain